MHKGFLRAGALFSTLAVMLGAFAAHSIKEKVTAEVLTIFETGVRYQMFHSIALLITGILFWQFRSVALLWAGRLFIVGIILFSGSLYLLCYLKTVGITVLSGIGMITPFGGAAFIAGWIFLVIALSANKKTV
ncbi:MAG: DUF423 domain-containing protein [Ferruginibacter sp.]